MMTTLLERPDSQTVGSIDAPVAAPASFPRIGTQGWSFPDWEGLLYPKGLRQPDRLALYAQTFNSVEVNTTFYGVPAREAARSWYAATPEDFVFALKMPRAITHERRLRDVEPTLTQFLRSAGELGDKLGPILIQLPPYFGASGLPALSEFLRRLPVDEMRFCVEIRRPALRSPGVRNLLLRRGVGMATTNLVSEPGDVDVVNGFAYLRLLGPRHAYVRNGETPGQMSLQTFLSQAGRWAAGLRLAMEGAGSAYAFISNDYFGPGVLPAAYWMKLFGMPVHLQGMTSFFDEPVQGVLL